MSEVACTNCGKKFSSAESLNQHFEAKHKTIARKPAKKRLWIWLTIIGVLASGFWIYTNSTKPGKFDDFAKCLTEKGAIMYGAIEWCKYTQEQAAMFGKSFKYINYQDYKKGPNIQVTPTWIINNSLSGNVRLERVQPFSRLADLTGCKLE